MIALYAEDDLDDFDMFSDIVKILNPSFQSVNVRNGQEVLDFLESAVILPDIIFLDINMPLVDGRSCLKFIKKDSKFSSIPVVIYSTSHNPQDMELCLQLGALAYVEKPFTFKEGVDRLSKFIK